MTLRENYYSSCRVCGAFLKFNFGNSIVTCNNCGTESLAIFSGGKWTVQDVNEPPDVEILERVEQFAHLRGYRFNQAKDRIIRALLKKRDKYGDFYCPCKVRLVIENVCPCSETREGKVESKGSCTCGLFWKT